MAIKHKFVSAIADDSNASLVRPSNWNDDHEFSPALTANGVLYSTGTDILADADMTFDGSSLTLAKILKANGGISSDDLTDLAWGIQNQNLVDKTALESISKTWTWTAEGIKLNNAIPITFETGATDITLTPTADTLTLALGADDFLITTSGLTSMFKGSNGFFGIGVTPTTALHVVAGNENAATLQTDISSGTKLAMIYNIITTGTSDLTSITGCRSTIGISGDHTNINNARASLYRIRFNSDGGATTTFANELVGMEVFIEERAGNDQSYDIPALKYIDLSGSKDGSGTFSGTDQIGINIENLPYTLTNSMGIKIAKQTAGTSNNWGIVLAGDGNGIYFGEGNATIFDMSIDYDGTDGNINTSLVAASDLEITCGANKTIELQNVVYKDINIGAAMLSLPAATAPDEDEFVDEAGDDTDISTWAFAIGEQVSGNFEIQHDYKEGTDLVFHIHWQGIAAPTGTDNVQWRLTYTLSEEGNTLDAPTIVDSPDAAIDTQYSFHRTNVATIDGATKGNNGGNIEIGNQFLFTIERVAATGDAYAGDALIATVGVHYQVDTMGSRMITTK